MNITESESPYLVEGKTCGCNERGKSISYQFLESSHNLCLNKGELMLGQIQACESACIWCMACVTVCPTNSIKVDEANLPVHEDQAQKFVDS